MKKATTRSKNTKLKAKIPCSALAAKSKDNIKKIAF
jgi:hypothetical protein